MAEELFRTLIIPDGARIEENNIVLNGGDVLIGNHAEVGYGVLANKVIAGERIRLKGSLIAEEEIRVDMWSEIVGDVKTKGDAYLGEFVKIHGKLMVKGDLDIGNDVQIDEGFEAKGWIVIRNPVPVIVYIFMYLMEMLRLGKGEEVEKVMSELFEVDGMELSERTMIIPNGSKVTYELMRAPGKVIIGDGCRLIGNIRATSAQIGDSNTLFGSIRTRDNITIGNGTEVHGNLISGDTVYIGDGSHILGEINAQTIRVHEDALVKGAMHGVNGVFIVKEEEEESEEESSKESEGSMLDVE